MARLTTIVCALSAVMTIVDYFTAKTFFAQWLARHLTWTENGCQISPALNFVIIVGVLAGIWVATGGESKPAADGSPTARRSHWQAYLMGCFLFVWFIAGPPLATSSPPEPANPGAQTGGATLPRQSMTPLAEGTAPAGRPNSSVPPVRSPLRDLPPPPSLAPAAGSGPAPRPPSGWRPGEVLKSLVRPFLERSAPPGR